MQTQYQPDAEMYEEEKGGRTATDYLILLKKGWIWIVLGAAICGSVSLISALSTPDQFQTAAQIMVEKVDKQERVDGSREMVMPSWSVEDDYFGTQAALLTSNKIISEAISDMSLPKGTRVIGDTGKGAGGMFGGAAGGSVYRVAAKRLAKSRLITLSVNGPNPILCAKIANMISSIYLRENAMQNLFISKQIYKWLEDDGRGEAPVDPAQRAELADSMQTVINDPELIKLRNDKESILNNLRELSMRYRPAHPRIRELSHTLEELNKSIDKRKERLIANLKRSLEGSLSVTNVRILDPAVVPQSPSGPDRFGMILMGIMGGAAAGAGLVILLELMNQKVRTEKDLPNPGVTAYLGAIPTIGVLDKIKAKGSAQTSMYVRILNDNLELRDAVVGIRTHILFSTTYEKTKRVMFVNSVAEEGKSTVAILISLSLASMGRKILLIEADLRQPSIAHNLGLDLSRGLSDVLSGEAEIGQVIQTVPGATLDVLSGGTPTNQSSSLLSSARFDQLLDSMSGLYDRIILIAPPILSSPDSLIIAKNISCGILVCASRVTDRESVRESEQKFAAMKRPLVGVVINKLDQTNSVYAKSGGGVGSFINKHIHLKPFPGSMPNPKSVIDPVKTIKSN